MLKMDGGCFHGVILGHMGLKCLSVKEKGGDFEHSFSDAENVCSVATVPRTDRCARLIDLSRHSKSSMR